MPGDFDVQEVPGLGPPGAVAAKSSVTFSGEATGGQNDCRGSAFSLLPSITEPDADSRRGDTRDH